MQKARNHDESLAITSSTMKRNARTSATLITLGMFLLATVACGASADEGTSTMRLEPGCELNECTRMQEARAADCNSCIDSCMASLCDYQAWCGSSCKSTECYAGTEQVCARQGFVATIPQNADATHEAACLKTVDHLKSCGLDFEKSRKLTAACGVWAKVERPEIAAVYECVASKACGDDASGCLPPRSTLGDEVCKSFESIANCSVCTAEQREELNDNGNWIRDDVAAALRTCAEQSACSNVQKCFRAWRKAVRIADGGESG